MRVLLTAEREEGDMMRMVRMMVIVMDREGGGVGMDGVSASSSVVVVFVVMLVAVDDGDDGVGCR